MVTGHRTIYDVPFIGWCVKISPTVAAAVPRPTALESSLESTLRLHSLAPRGTSGERAGERGNPIKPNSSPQPSPPPSSKERERTASVSLGTADSATRYLA